MENENSITVEDFVLLLWNRLKSSAVKNPEEIFHSGREQGWLDDEDERFSGNPLNKRNAAKIVHLFMRTEMKISDCADISEAEFLKDLYTCRVCANHIAQVFVRKIMDSEEVEYDGQIVQIFNHLKLVSCNEAEIIVSKIQEISS